MKNIKWAILISWLLVGSLDILAAIMQTLIGGGSILRLMQYIASGAFGAVAFEGGVGYAVSGLVIHYSIALTWTVLFYLAYPRLSFGKINKIVLGIGYGTFVWLIMNRVVLPLSNIKMGAFDLQRAIIAALVLIVAIGLPLSFLAGKHFSAHRESSDGQR